MTTNTTRILDVSPYNTFSATCSATVEVTGLEGRVQLRRRWQWKRRGVGGVSFLPVSDMFHTDSGSVSVLSKSETTSGSAGYRCRCDLEGTDNIHDTDEVFISVTGNLKVISFLQSLSFNCTLAGPTAPSPPPNVSALGITHNRATIQWTVPSIAYTPETYVVEYGTSQDNLGLTSGSQHSGPDITVTDVTYSLQLSGLRVGTEYHFTVVANNSEGYTESQLDMFHTNELGTHNIL